MLVSLHTGLGVQSAVTFICVLSRELGNSIADLATDRVVGFVGEAAEQLRAYGFSLGVLEGEKEVRRLAGGCLARLGGLAPEEDGSEGPGLAKRVSLVRGQEARVLVCIPKCPGRARSAPTGPSRAPQASGRPILRSTAAPHSFAGRCRETADLGAGPQAQCEPRLAGQTWWQCAGSVVVGSGPVKWCEGVRS
jgi:hypothetical protein